jgi:hypothetical protein
MTATIVGLAFSALSMAEARVCLGVAPILAEGNAIPKASKIMKENFFSKMQLFCAYQDKNQ